MEVVDDSHGHLADQRVPPSAGTVAFHDHHDGSLDSAYEENFECGEEAIQRQLLITRILSSPLLFCASSSPDASSTPTLKGCDGVADSPVSFSSSCDDDSTPNSLEISRAETEEYELGSSSPLKRMSENVDLEQSSQDQPRTQDIWTLQKFSEINCDTNAVKISNEVTHQKNIRCCQVACVVQQIVDRVVIDETINESIDNSNECDGLLTSSEVRCLSWRTRRPMSGRSISTDSGVSSVDDSRLSHSSSDYAASPAAVSDTSDDVQTQETKTRRRSARLDFEQAPPPKLLRGTNTAKLCATTSKRTTTTTNILTSSLSSSSSSCSSASSILSINECIQKTTCSVTAQNGPTTTGFLQTRLSSKSSSKPSSSIATTNTSAVACRWTDCQFVAAKDNDLADHIADAHVAPQGEKGSFVCLWESCKVFNVPSTLKHWLEQHVVKHSRSKPLKCIVDGCPQRFSTKALLETHVNSHFEKNPKLKNESALKTQQLLKLAKKKRLLRQNSKMQAGRKYDFFDAYIMHQIKERLLQSAETGQIPSSTSTFAPAPSPASIYVDTATLATPLNSAPEPLPAPRKNRRKRSITTAAPDNNNSSNNRRNVALTNELNEVAPSPDSGCSSLRESDGVNFLIRAVRQLPSGQRQMLISYYKPRTADPDGTDLR